MTWIAAFIEMPVRTYLTVSGFRSDSCFETTPTLRYLWIRMGASAFFTVCKEIALERKTAARLPVR
jgi:hypothetical protein